MLIGTSVAWPSLNHHGLFRPAHTGMPRFQQFRNDVLNTQHRRTRKYEIVELDDKVQVFVEASESNKNGLFSAVFNQDEQTLVVTDNSNPSRFKQVFNVPTYVVLEDFSTKMLRNSFLIEIRTKPNSNEFSEIPVDNSLVIEGDHNYEAYERKDAHAVDGYFDTTGIYRNY